MSLKINLSVKKIIKWCVFGVCLVLFAIFFLRVVIWEDAYYREKEGSERDVIETIAVAPQEELEEEQPTEAEVVEYVVAPDKPRYLTIEKLGVYNARILQMGVNAQGELDTPRNIFDVGWYESSYKPGGGGTIVLDGHNGGPTMFGVFKRLPELVEGDIIQIERGDGVIFRYKVAENVSVPLAESDAYMSTALRSPEIGKESVTLITCTGEWSQQQGTYLSRQFLRAVLTE